MQENQNTPDQESDWNQLRPQLDVAIDELKEPDRLAVLLRYFENRSFAEIGAALRVSEDAARVRVNRALDKLRALLVRRGITSTAGALALALSSQSALATPPALAASVTGFALTSSVAVGVSSITSVLTFMSTTKTIITTTSVLAAFAVGTAVFESREARQVQAGLAASVQENASLRERLQHEAARAAAIEGRLRSAEELAASLKATSGDAEVAKKTAAQMKQVSTQKPGAKAIADVQFDMLMNNPEYQELSTKQYRSSLRFLFGPLYNKLGLSAAQIADFEEAKIEQQQASMDVFAAARAQGLSPADP